MKSKMMGKTHIFTLYFNTNLLLVKWQEMYLGCCCWKMQYIFYSVELKMKSSGPFGLN